MTRLCLLFCVLILMICNAAAVEKNALEKGIETIASSDDVVGLAVAVVRKGEVSLLSTHGLREIGGIEKITPQTNFRIASLSKGFAATVTAQLAEEGKLSFDNSITRFNSDFQLRDPQQANSVTLAHVLSHRLSLPPYAYDNLLEAGVSPPKILREMQKVDPVCKVGTCYAYQNVGFNMITSAIESIAKQPYSSVVKDRLFTPLGMSDASFGRDSLVSSDNWARSHQRTNGRSWKVRDVKQPYYDVPAAGGVNANIVDMAKWLIAQMGHAPAVISTKAVSVTHTPLVKTYAELRRNRRLERLTQAHYGLGWRIYKYADQTVINHSGSVEGYVAQIAFLPEQDVGMVVLANSRSRQFWDILPLFLDHELGLDNALLMDRSIETNL